MVLQIDLFSGNKWVSVTPPAYSEREKKELVYLHVFEDLNRMVVVKVGFLCLKTAHAKRLNPEGKNNNF